MIAKLEGRQMISTVMNEIIEKINGDKDADK
jgi:hypothetical protein